MVPRGWARRIRSLVLLSAAVFVVVPPLQVTTVRFVEPMATPTMVWQTLGHAVAVGWERPSHQAVTLADLGPHIPLVAVSAEDQTFFLHSGFDDRQICVAVAEWRAGKSLRGASTISQQVARNLFLWHGGGFFRKGLEALYTVWLELLLPKERILEIYLNIAETGPLTYGFEAAAQRWYGKTASDLTLSEAARLVTLLPAPTSRDPRDAAAGRRAARILRSPGPVPWRSGFAEAQSSWEQRTRRLPQCLW